MGAGVGAGEVGARGGAHSAAGRDGGAACGQASAEGAGGGGARGRPEPSWEEDATDLSLLIWKMGGLTGSPSCFFKPSLAFRTTCCHPQKPSEILRTWLPGSPAPSSGSAQTLLLLPADPSAMWTSHGTPIFQMGRWRLQEVLGLDEVTQWICPLPVWGLPGPQWWQRPCMGQKLSPTHSPTWWASVQALCCPLSTPCSPVSLALPWGLRGRQPCLASGGEPALLWSLQWGGSPSLGFWGGQSCSEVQEGSWPYPRPPPPSLCPTLLCQTK